MGGLEVLAILYIVSVCGLERVRMCLDVEVVLKWHDLL